MIAGARARTPGTGPRETGVAAPPGARARAPGTAATAPGPLVLAAHGTRRPGGPPLLERIAERVSVRPNGDGTSTLTTS